MLAGEHINGYNDHKYGDFRQAPIRMRIQWILLVVLMTKSVSRKVFRDGFPFSQVSGLQCPCPFETRISLRFNIQNSSAYFLTASPNTRRKFLPPIFPISSGVKPVFNMASTTT